MVVGDIADKNLQVDFEKSDSKYILTTQKISLEIFKKDFRIMVYNSQGELITESGSKTKNEFSL